MASGDAQGCLAFWKFDGLLRHAVTVQGQKSESISHIVFPTSSLSGKLSSPQPHLII